VTAEQSSHPNWPEFAQRLAQAGGVEPGAIRPDTSLVADLALDSLTLAELVIWLIERYAPATMVHDLEDHDWDRMTAGRLFDECTAGSRGQGHDRLTGADSPGGRS
jgi:hypothetical protein